MLANQASYIPGYPSADRHRHISIRNVPNPLPHKAISQKENHADDIGFVVFGQLRCCMLMAQPFPEYFVLFRFKNVPNIFLTDTVLVQTGGDE